MRQLVVFNNKKVLITGHTGFKGSWLALWLSMLGAKVMGISNKIITNPSNFKAIKLKNEIISKNVDIRNLKKTRSSIIKFQPDFIFHLAAQSLVKKSYEDPIYTYETNIIGTLNILESLRYLRKTKLPEKAHELEKQVSQLSKQANELFKKKPATLKENITTIKVKNLDTGKVIEAFVLTDATNGKSMLLSLDTNRPVGKHS